MDCRTCEPTLIDLVHDELATDAAREARAHLAECASCRASFERLVAAQKLASELEVVPAPQQVTARLLQLADARAAELRAAAAPVVEPPSLGRRLLDFIARFATGPQVGMATIMLLIAAVGLWSLPRMKREPVASGTVVDADGEAAASPGVEPADRLDLKVDSRSRRIRSGGAPLAPAAPAAPVSAATEAVAVAAPAPPSPLVDKKLAEDPLAKLDDFDDLIGSGGGDLPAPPAEELEEKSDVASANAETTARRKRPAKAESADGDTPGSLQRLSEASASAGPQAFPASEAEAPAAEAEADEQQVAAANAVRSSRKAKAGAAEAQSQGAPASAPPPPKSPRPALDDLLSDSVARKPSPAPKREPEMLLQPYRAESGSGRSAAQSAGQGAAQGTAQSSGTLLAAARSVASARGCAAALPSYERVVASAPGSRDAGTALIEMAQCRRTLGQSAEANRLLERAVQIPATSERARSLQTKAATTPAAAPASSD